MMFEHQSSCETRAGANTAIAPKIGYIPQTLRDWVKHAEKDSGMRDGATTEGRDRIKVLERKVRELREANKILRKGKPVKAPRVQAHWRRLILRRRNSTAH